MDKIIENKKFDNFSTATLIITLILNIALFLCLIIWSISAMGDKHDMSLNKLLSDDTFAVISLITTLGTAILGGILPSVYGLLTSPTDKEGCYRAISDWEKEERNNVKDVMMLLPFSMFSILILLFIFQFSFTKQFNCIAIIIFIIISIAIIILIIYAIYKFMVSICRYFSKVK
ncbi:hypothetical protein MXE58_05490 [Staphylococcus epidermidis]|uniref:hypothetical protein n=2 Tax=Bacteria TaxID=2 RepID=UPI001D153CC7|nr:hypothetical protein [Staphylococcus epidermidis]MCC3673863.1 hypothetical protein [Staphylococcus epidermidis]MEB5679184.1 hypothetical protein [Staphylococcus epidermidis]